MMNQNKVILDLCGGTGAWSRPYQEAGYDVRIITLPQFDIREAFMRGDGYYMFPMAEKYKDTMIVGSKNVYGILAAPPCTMFSLARTRAKTPRDFSKGMELVEKCLVIIWEVRKRQKLAFWALENPVGYLRQFLGKPAFTFHPYDFGESYTKKTDLWGYFDEPKKKRVKLSEDDIKRSKINNRKLPSISDFTGSKQSARRAITPSGFSQAFFQANQ